MKNIRLKADSRSKDFIFSKHFGNVSEFPTEYIVPTPMQDVVQGIGNVECTCITCCDIAGQKDNVPYDFDELFSRIPHSNLGASPQDALGETVKKGLLPRGLTDYVKDFSSYFSAHQGTMSAFDNIRSALLIAKYPVAIFTNWYDNWGADVLPVGNRAVSGHMYIIEGWKLINGTEMLQIEAWQGRKHYMPAETLNDALSKFGCGTAVLSTDQIDSIRRKTFREQIIDACQNCIILLLKLKAQLS